MWTTAKIIDLLGGVAKTAELTGRSGGSVANWRSMPTLPASLFLLMSRELLAQGIVAPPRLWGMEDRPLARGSLKRVRGEDETREVA